MEARGGVVAAVVAVAVGHLQTAGQAPLRFGQDWIFVGGFGSAHNCYFGAKVAGKPIVI